MYRPVALGVAVTMAVASGCSSGDGQAERRPEQVVVADSVAAPTAVDPHAGHVMGDSSAGAGTDAMTGMDHGSAAPSAAADHAGHAGMEGMEHGAGRGRSPASARGVDHSAHGAAAGSSGTAGGAASGGSIAVDHSRHTAATATATVNSSTAVGHTQHAQASARTGQPRTSGVDHSAHAAGAARSATPAHRDVDHTATATRSHGQHANTPSVSPAPLATGAGMDKLMFLVAELVRDSVVQRRIQEDPVLREQWQDPGVRQIILRRP